ncbi:MAG: hypothetical protein G01um1014106_262 [Parcubacteria group bacterium Gr01-1014_106]|nr:MAG: hypothetical protein G01um1014106_262 [Parcubacteria group bacterium Gr01-1014_106]
MEEGTGRCLLPDVKTKVPGQSPGYPLALHYERAQTQPSDATIPSRERPARTAVRNLLTLLDVRGHPPRNTGVDAH